MNPPDLFLGVQLWRERSGFRIKFLKQGGELVPFRPALPLELRRGVITLTREDSAYVRRPTRTWSYALMCEHCQTVLTRRYTYDAPPGTDQSLALMVHKMDVWVRHLMDHPECYVLRERQ